MPRNPKQPWKPRFSLKTFLLACLVSAVAVAWVSQSYKEYLAEQQLIEVLTQGLSSSSVLTINGEARSFGRVLM
jgi:hypothetical protein